MASQDPKEYWLHGSRLMEKISLAVLAYAAGDAFGVQFEFGPKLIGEIEHVLVGKEGWPFGGVSDDTLLSILTIKALASARQEGVGQFFLESLKAAVPQLRGLGPTTRSALGLPVKEEELSEIGFSNGGMMRTALLGLGFGPEERDVRRRWVGELTAATHSLPVALDCAQILAAGFSFATASNSVEETLRAIEDDFETYVNLSVEVSLAMSSWRNWNPPNSGISNNSLETLLAVLYVLRRAKSTKDAFSIACKLGGDTDTVAALAGALYAATMCDGEAFFAIEWIKDVDWVGIVGLEYAMKILIERRAQVE